MGEKKQIKPGRSGKGWKPKVSYPALKSPFSHHFSGCRGRSREIDGLKLRNKDKIVIKVWKKKTDLE